MKRPRLSLQWRIFLTMMLIVLTASLLIIGVTVFQYRQQASDYHIKRLHRKEGAVKRDLENTLRNTTWFVNTKNLKYIFRDEIYVLSNVHRMEINMYDLEGNLLISSKVDLVNDDKISERKIGNKIVEALKNDVPEHSLIREINDGKNKYKISYSYIYDNKGNPIGILSLPYKEESKFFRDELKEFLHRVIMVFVLVLIFTGFLAFLLSRYITGPISHVTQRIRDTQLQGKNRTITIDKGSKEIFQLVESYNAMIDKLNDSAEKLVRSEREYAWREMAKQVAHEIKNPLTPMRLSIQSFQRKIQSGDKPTDKEMRELGDSLIRQIDLMSSIASAFSDFAKMPTAKKEPLNIVEVVRQTVDLFPENYIKFFAAEKNIELLADKTQLIRVVTNLITNARQALVPGRNPMIEIKVEKRADKVIIRVADNGKGMDDYIKEKIFEPKFTTKTTGMGLGLAMVKNIVETYGGRIYFTSQINLGTVFTVEFPISVPD